MCSEKIVQIEVVVAFELALEPPSYSNVELIPTRVKIGNKNLYLIFCHISSNADISIYKFASLFVILLRISSTTKVMADTFKW